MQHYTPMPLTLRGGGRGDGRYTTKNTRILFNKLFLFTTALPRDPHVKTKTVFPRDDMVWHSHALFIYKYIAYCKVCTTSPLTAYSPSRVVATQRCYSKCVATKVVSRQPNNMSTSCCHVATSERRHIQSKADNNSIALREASIRRSQRGNNSATPHTISTTFAATPLSTYLSCVVTARRTALGQYLAAKHDYYHHFFQYVSNRNIFSMN